MCLIVASVAGDLNRDIVRNRSAAKSKERSAKSNDRQQKLLTFLLARSPWLVTAVLDSNRRAADTRGSKT